MKERWVVAAFTSDALVAELLLRLKQSSSSDSSHAPPPTTSTAAFLNPLGWGNRKSRSKPSTTTTTVANGFKKEQQRSPSTPLSWSGGAAASSSNGYDESDLPDGGRSTKAPGYHGYLKSRKRKIELYQTPEKEVDAFVQISSCKVEPEIETHKRLFVLPDLNMTPKDEELVVP